VLGYSPFEVSLVDYGHPPPLTLGPRDYIRSECCVGGRPMTTPHVKLSLAPSHWPDHEPGQVTCTVSQVFDVTWPGRVH